MRAGRRVVLRPSVEFDVRTGCLLAAPATLLFAGLEVAQPAMREPLSEAAARRFLATFASALEAAGRVFSTAEVVEALQRSYRDAPMASTRQVGRLLRQMKPPAWAAGGGRRPVFQMPSATEIVAAGEAGRQAAESLL